ncbi:phosphatidic acid phosphatase-related / PAP2-like protein [Perilla frutescens var. hirtella]|nr:phosphatidic acid phosphatase-related / PAP2-like protein [Perilla frutescens var. hirtella]
MDGGRCVGLAPSPPRALRLRRLTVVFHGRRVYSQHDPAYGGAVRSGLRRHHHPPPGFLGSGADFPVGNVSFFLFYSGHVAASVIASLDMKRMQRWELAYAFDTLNVLQVVRLLTTRGHYTIDLAVGVGAGVLFDSLAGKYVESKKGGAALCNGNENGGLHKSPK